MVQYKMPEVLDEAFLKEVPAQRKYLNNLLLVVFTALFVGVVSNGQTAQIGDVLSEGHAAVHVFSRQGFEGIVLINKTIRQFLKSCTVFFCPPVGQVSVHIVFAPLIIEAMGELVPDHSTDPSVVHGIICFRIEERRLQYARWKDDLIETRIVVGVHNVRAHEPFGLVHGLIDLSHIFLKRVSTDLKHIVYQ